MKEPNRRWRYLPLGILKIFGIILVIIYTIKTFWNILSSVENEIAAALITASVTAIISVISLILGKYYENVQTINQQLRDKKIPIYEQFIEFIFDLMWGEKIKGKRMSEAEMQRFFTRFTQKLVSWGSDEVISKWGSFRKELINYASIKDNELSKAQFPKIMFMLEDLLLAIRKDIGYKNNNIHRGDILRLFINDIDQYL